MKRSLSILSILILILNACQQNMKTPEGDFSIHAIVQGIDTVIFEKIEANDLILIDTLFAIDGEFVVANSLEGSAFFLLRTPEGEGINLLIEKVLSNTFFCVIINFWDFELNECQLERWESRAFLPHYLCYFVSYKS